ncbi:MAG: cache domain-containing protein [Verrucomicrobiota bacterium]
MTVSIRTSFFSLGLVMTGLGLGSLPLAAGEAETAAEHAAVEKALAPVAAQFVAEQPGKEPMLTAMKAYLEANPQIYGIAYAPPPPPEGEPVPPSLYVYRHEGKLDTRLLKLPEYNYPADEWYAKPKQEQRPIWTHPYFDKGGGDIWMQTYSVPLYLDGDKARFWGILTSDLPVPPPPGKSADGS